MEVSNKLANLSFELAFSDQVELRFRVLFLHLGEGSDNDIHAIVTMKSASTHEMRAQLAALAEGKLFQINHVRNDFRWQVEFTKHIREIVRRDYRNIHLF